MVKFFQLITRPVYKGIAKVLQCCVQGLEQSYTSSGASGLASTLHILEIAHTHHWAKEIETTTTPGSGTQSLVKFLRKFYVLFG